MKKDFFAGLALLLPVVLTLAIIAFIVNLLTRPFLGIVQEVFRHFELLNSSFFFLSSEQVINLIAKFLILISLMLVTLLIGFLTNHFILRSLLKTTDAVIQRIPLINKIYRALQEVMNTLFNPASTTFSEVVLVPYPYDSTFAIAFVTKDCLPEGSDKDHMDMISVFLPGTPNPMMGFNLLYRREQVIFLDMKVDDALKFLVSCGVIDCPLQVKKPIESE